MLKDILTVMWKETKMLLRDRSSRTRLMLVLLSPIILAIYVASDAGPRWAEGFPSLLIAALAPVILVGVTIPDSFAGERERRTLETLLASRLPDRAILFGKLAVAVAFAWGVTVVILLLSLVAANVAHWDGEIFLYRPPVALADLASSFLLATLTAGVGVLISLRSATVQEATQTLMALFLLSPMLLGMLLFAFSDQVGAFFRSLDAAQILFVGCAVLAALDGAVLAAAMARFQRSRLISR